MADLVTLANVKSYLWPGESITQWDAILPSIISAVSEQVNREVGCVLLSATYTAELVNGKGTSALEPLNWPITDVTSIVDSYGAAYAEGNDADFVIDAFCLRKVNGVWAEGRGNFTVTYTAGYATIPADIALVCYEAIAQAWKTMSKQSWGESTRTFPDGSVGFINTDGGLTKVQRGILARYKKLTA
jgi:hypothetical protein